MAGWMESVDRALGAFQLATPFNTTKAPQLNRSYLPGKQFGDHIDVEILKYALPYSKLFIKALVSAVFTSASSNLLKDYCFISLSLPVAFPMMF